MTKRTKKQWTKLFEKVQVRRPAEWAQSEMDEDLGNLTAFAFLRQAWNEIPATGETAWLKEWMKEARTSESATALVGAYDRLVAAGASQQDIVVLLRGALGQFLYQLTYLLDDNSIEDEDLQSAARWGLWEESEDGEPTRRLGAIHELVFEADVEHKDG